jgi:Fe2+ transport system protein FeoA
LDLNSTLSCKVNGTALIIRNVTDDLSLQAAAFTGKKEFRLMGYSRDPQITITQDAPLNLQINGLVAELIF